jgi:hypothetical protein
METEKSGPDLGLVTRELNVRTIDLAAEFLSPLPYNCSLLKFLCSLINSYMMLSFNKLFYVIYLIYLRCTL